MSDDPTEFHQDAPVEARPAKVRKISRRWWQAGAMSFVLLVGIVLALVGQQLYARFEGGNEMRITAYQAWRVVCAPSTGQGGCVLTQDVVPNQGGVLVALTMGSAELGSPLTITVPHGVMLEPGLGFSAGDDGLTVRPYDVCNPVGCVSNVPVDAEMLQALRENQDGQVIVVPGEGAPVTIPFSLDGFSEGYDAFVRVTSRRNFLWGIFAR
ncbi:MAG: invasion associated locus B family protein [Proteobacteria bacterium]|nr:invasion associated locus B family protein [Pseudomonadota bacterium]